MPNRKEKACVIRSTCHYIGMKHSESGNRKVLKQLRKCPDIKSMHSTAHGYRLRATNGEEWIIHLSAKAFHPLRRWLKKNTRIKNLKF